MDLLNYASLLLHISLLVGQLSVFRNHLTLAAQVELAATLTEPTAEKPPCP